MFNGLLADSTSYSFGITPEDPKDEKCCYFNIWFEKQIVNESSKKIVFYAKTYSGFKVRNNAEKPTVECFFDAIKRATRDFALEFHLRTQGTNLAHHRILKPQFSELEPDIQKTIDIWDHRIRNSSIKSPPNWQVKFRDLPEIPEPKRWAKDSHSTLEQDISFKLLKNRPITADEQNAFVGLTSFYEELDKKLAILDYHSLILTNEETRN